MERKGCYRCGKFPQRFCEYYGEKDGLLSDAAFRLACDGAGKVYIGTENGLNYTKDDGSFGSFPCGKIDVIYARRSEGAVYFASDKTVYLFKNGTVSELQTFEERIAGISGEKELFLVTASALYRLEGGEFKFFFPTDLPAEGLECSGGKLVSFSGDRLLIFAGKRKHWMSVYHEHSTMPEFKINVVKYDAALGFLWLGTDKGVYVYDGACGWSGRGDIDCLPEEKINSIDFASDGGVVLGSDAGLIVLKNGASKYLPASRWSRDENALDAIAAGSDIWTASKSGVTKIYEKEIALREKADYFFELAEKHFVRPPGFVTDLRGVKNGDLSSGRPAITDNDGLWTQTYIAALCYCYAVTKDEKVLAAARRSTKACGLLARVSGIKGFPARAVRFENDLGYGVGTEENADWNEWHKAPDGKCEWLGETSSDEITGHFFGFSLYYDLCADDDEKASIREIVAAIVDHILEHDYRLYDCDGKPTTWAFWTPSELNYNSMWLWEKGVNSLEMLAFLDVAYHMTGNEKYRGEFLRLAVDEHFLLNAAHHKKDDARVTHIDDNLAFLATVTILRLEKDEAVRKYLLMGLRSHWNYERSEKNPLWNFIFGAFTNEVCDIDSAVKALRDAPADPVNRRIHNGNRKNLVFDAGQERWGGQKQLLSPLALDERPGGGNPYGYDGGDDSSALCPRRFLLPY